jgi:hypothetical protein
MCCDEGLAAAFQLLQHPRSMPYPLHSSRSSNRIGCFARHPGKMAKMLDDPESPELDGLMR